LAEAEAALKVTSVAQAVEVAGQELSVKLKPPQAQAVMVATQISKVQPKEIH